MPLNKQPLHKVPLAFLDVETTGLRPDLGHRVIEIAVLQTQGLEKAREFSTLINPQRPIDPGAARVNGINDEMVVGAPSFVQILPQLQDLLAGRVLVAHNAPFDLNFLHAEYTIARTSFEPGPILDTLKLARRQYHFYSNSLGNIAKNLHIRTPHAHRALGDALTTYAVFRRFSGDLTRKNRPLVQDWIRMQGGVAWRAPSAEPLLDDSHPIQIALSQSRKVEIRYQSGRYESKRVIEPLTLNGNYLVAFCHLRGEQRTFRLDRIKSAELLKE